MAGARARWIVVLVIGLGLTAISLAAEGDVNLVGSNRGFEGKLLIEHNSVRRTVCHDGWTHTDSDTVCKQLGYSKGAMITRASTGEFTGVAGSPTVKSPGCIRSNSRLSDCAGFSYQEDFSCSAEVDLSCYVNDFNGCHFGNPLDWATLELLLSGVKSIEHCIGLCRDRGYGFVAISGNRCLCGAQSGTRGPLVSTVNCATPCGEDAMEACGTNDGTSMAYYTIWPTSVGASGGTLTTPNGCIYSRGFPGPYPTTSQPETNQYTVSLPAAKFVVLEIPVFDIYATDRLEITSGTTVALTAPSSPNDAVVPFNAPISGFTLTFVTEATSPTQGNSGFVVCYESLDALPTMPPTTTPPTIPSKAPPTNAPTPSSNPPSVPPTSASSMAPSSAGPVETSPPPSSPLSMGSGSSSSDTMFTLAASSSMQTEKSSMVPTEAPTTSTEHPQNTECALYHGATVEQRRDRDPNDVLLLNTGNPFNCTGFIRGLSYFSANQVPFKISIWSVYDTDKYVLEGETAIGAASGDVTSVTLDRSDWLPFLPGNIMGVSFQTSPLVWSDAATSNGEATQWIIWLLNDADPQHRDTAKGTIITRAYSVSAELRDRKFCLIPNVLNSEPTDAVVSVYEGQLYILRCRSKYRPAKQTGPYLCQADGSFDRDLVCEAIERIFPFGFTFAQLIICVVVLVCLCLAVFVVVCMMVCCRGSPEGKKKHLVESGGETDNGVDEGDGNCLVLIDSENGEFDNPVQVDDTADLDSLPTSLPESTEMVNENGPADDTNGLVGDTEEAAGDIDGTAVIDNPIADVSFKDGFIYGYPTADYDDLQTPPSPPTISSPPPPPPPPPLPGTNPPFTSNDLPTPPPYSQSISLLGGSAPSIPDSPDAGSDAALITDNVSDANLSRRGRPTRRAGTGIASRLGIFES